MRTPSLPGCQKSSALVGIYVRLLLAPWLSNQIFHKQEREKKIYLRHKWLMAYKGPGFSGNSWSSIWEAGKQHHLHAGVQQTGMEFQIEITCVFLQSECKVFSERLCLNLSVLTSKRNSTKTSVASSPSNSINRSSLKT